MSKREKKNFHIPVLLLLVQLAVLFFIKYSNQNLPISEFSFRSAGNLFLIVIYFIFIAGLLLSAFKPSNKISNKIFYSYLALTFILLASAFISSLTDPGLNEIYLLGQTGNKLFTSLLYSVFLLVFISFFVYVWRNILFKGNFSLLKNIYSSLLMLFIFLLLTFIYANTLSYTTGKWQLTKSKNNTAVVLGAAVWSGNLPSPTLSYRVDKALELVNNGFAGKILLTGSSAPGEMTEAESALNYLLAKGVDTSFVSIETSSTSTTEQIQFIKSELSRTENTGDIIVISDAYHLPRIVEIAAFVNTDIKVAESGHRLDFEDKFYNKIRECVALFIFWCFAL